MLMGANTSTTLYLTGVDVKLNAVSLSRPTSDRVVPYIAAPFARHGAIVTDIGTALCPRTAHETKFNVLRALIVLQKWTPHTHVSLPPHKNPMSTDIQHFYTDHTTVQCIFQCSLIQDPSKCLGPHASHPIQCSESLGDPPHDPALAHWALPPWHKECLLKKGDFRGDFKVLSHISMRTECHENLLWWTGFSDRQGSSLTALLCYDCYPARRHDKRFALASTSSHEWDDLNVLRSCQMKDPLQYFNMKGYTQNEKKTKKHW